MRCPDVMAEVPHSSHWYTVFADNIAIADGVCHGYQPPLGVNTTAAAMREIERGEKAIFLLEDAPNRDHMELIILRSTMTIVKKKLSQGAQ